MKHSIWKGFYNKCCYSLWEMITVKLYLIFHCIEHLLEISFLLYPVGLISQFTAVTVGFYIKWAPLVSTSKKSEEKWNRLSIREDNFKVTVSPRNPIRTSHFACLLCSRWKLFSMLCTCVILETFLFPGVSNCPFVKTAGERHMQGFL